MVLLGNVLQVLVLANLDGRFTLGVYGLKRSQIGSAFIDCHRLRSTVLIDRISKKNAEPQPCCAWLVAESRRCCPPCRRPDKDISIRQFLPTSRLQRRSAFSSTGNSLMAQRCTVE
jgi:hypothetical protein